MGNISFELSVTTYQKKKKTPRKLKKTQKLKVEGCVYLSLKKK